ncbi:MAG: cytochrome c3 family protein [Candidatus Latescibacterota bacterium]|nr:MAG: cytochrome c3 family protein [Candidatus Latescibacterota bacterium]
MAVAIATSVLIVVLPSTVESQRKTCVDCHEEFKKHLKKKIVHDPAKESCETCHKRHGFAQKLILVKNPPELCTDCHSNVADELTGDKVHVALSKGGCTVCHDPHASDEPGLMRETEEDKPACMLCHQELSEMVAREDMHEPFRKGNCASCHEPHSSDRPALLADQEAALCETCHSGAVAKHDIAGADDFSCSDCHDPHAASKKAPVAKYAHEPFVSGECESCHTVDEGEISLEDDFPRGDLCADCHDDKADAVAGGESHFGADALKTGGTAACLECHGAHSSRLPKLKVTEEKDLCRRCHKELADTEIHHGSMHAPFVEGECSVCHDPHGGGEHLFAKEVPVLCVSCHENKTAQLEEGRIRHEALGLMECIDCHTGHVSSYTMLLNSKTGEICTSCHDKVKHSEIHPPYANSNCQICHHNHSTRPGLLSAPMNDVCSRCHREQVSLVDAAVPHPPAQDEPCTMCHVPHGGDYAGLLNESQDALCYSCHELEDLVTAKQGMPQTEAEDEPFLHRPVEDGRCRDCHNPHGAEVKGLLEREEEKLCYGCHADEKVSFAKGNTHKPVAEGKCNTCHSPHGTTGKDLVKTSETILCAQCHDLNEASAKGAHKGFDVTNVKCTACHDPHVSPGDHLLKRYTHEPFADGSCGDCHEGAGVGAPDAGAVAATTVDPDVCVTCHDGKLDEKGHQHTEGVKCYDCHSPHASTFEALLLNPAKLCIGCHSELLQPGGEGAGTVRLHKPIEDGNCLDCHEMHAPAAADLLVKPPRQLCGSCHESIKERAEHPTQHDPFRKEQCSSCHTTHASLHRNLLKEREGSLCKSCHDFGGEKMKAAHKRIRPTGEACTSCHDPHSTAESASTLIRPVRHVPYEEDECAVCHDESGKPSTTVSVCLDCHDSADGFTSVHTGGRSGRSAGDVLLCLDCHSPHAAYDRLLLRDDQAQTCFQCHDRNEFSKSYVHGALEDDCTTCHDIHENNVGELQGLQVIDLCARCHETAESHAHPYGSKYTDPRNGRPLTCTTCHVPHSSEHEFILEFDRKRDLCVQCHVAGTMKVH